MEYKCIRELFFKYFLMQKELNIIEKEIDRYKRIMPYDNEPASLYVMSFLEKSEIEKEQKENEMDKIMKEINLFFNSK